MRDEESRGNHVTSQGHLKSHLVNQTWKGSQIESICEGVEKIYIKTSALLLVVLFFFLFEGLLLRIKELHHFRMTGSSDESIFIMMCSTTEEEILWSRLDGTDCTQHGVVVWNEEKF